ncbi:MAG: hypothetical protein IPK80_16990 [Nannocystis sp.]|nr:hypothetical protein [Nannocystis sp.]
MPTSNDSRAIKIAANNPAKVVDFDVAFSANFDSDLVAAYEYSDNSSGGQDLTIREYVFSSPATGAEIGRVSIRVRVFAELSDPSISVDRTGRSTSSTPPSGRGNQISAPQAQNLRRWAQDVSGAAGAALKNIAVVDVRSSIPGGSASHELRQNDATTLVIGVELADAAGTQASGAVTLSTAASPGDGFSLGPVRITDREDGGDAVRTTIGGPAGARRG